MDMSTLKQPLQQIEVEVSLQPLDQCDNSDRNQESSQDQHQPPSPPQQPVYPQRSDPESSDFMHNPNPIVNWMDPSGMLVSSHRQNDGDAMLAENGSSGQRDVAAVSSSSNQRPDDDPLTIDKIRKKQRRLFLLHHSLNCPHEDERCAVTPHCATIKRLWPHTRHCKDKECTVPHCFSSRYILHHFKKCRDTNCQVCGPTRETVKRNRALRSRISRTGSSRVL